jgi:perosamine synthetase
VPTLIPVAHPLIGAEERAAVDRVLRTGLLTQGPEVAAFEREYAAHFGLDCECVAVNSGTTGLHLGLVASGVGPGDEVIVPSFTFAGTANAVALTGATPIFADIDADTFCLDPESVAERITDRTVGIMPVHLYGQPAPMIELRAIADRHGLQLFEDAAQAHGASLYGIPVGTFGSFGMFSFYATKNMTTGEGGLVSVHRDEVARLLRLLRNQGMERVYENELVGHNARMTDLQAAIGRVQLTRIDELTERRQQHARFFDRHLRGVATPTIRPGAVHVFHQYTIRVAEDRDRVAQVLREEYGVATGRYYPTPVHRLPSFRGSADLPQTERAAQECLSLPVHPALSEDDLDRIVTAVNAVMTAGADA